METALAPIVTTITDATSAIGAQIPALAAAAIGVAVLIFGVRLGWRLVKSLAGR